MVTSHTITRRQVLRRIGALGVMSPKREELQQRIAHDIKLHAELVKAADIVPQ